MTECRLSWCLCRCWFAVSCFVCVLYLCFGGIFSFSIQQNREIHTFVPSWMYQVTRFQQLYSLRQSWSNYRKFVLSAIIKHNEDIWRSYTIRLYRRNFKYFKHSFPCEKSLPFQTRATLSLKTFVSFTMAQRNWNCEKMLEIGISSDN